MIRPIRSLTILFVLSCSWAVSSFSQAQSISEAQVESILTGVSSEGLDSFANFLERVETLDLAISGGLTELESRMRGGEQLNLEQTLLLQRLLGLYARVRYADLAVDLLTQMVAIPTFNIEGVPQHENPQFHKLAALIERLSEEFGLQFRNIDDRVYEVSLGNGGELLGIHAHADVVPVNPQLWQLPDGSPLDPFEVTHVGDRMYGRGTEDDKNGIVVALLAMKIMQEEGIHLARQFKLLIDTTEETFGSAIPYYFERNPVPDYNIALDGGYPVVIAEKGYGTVMASFPARSAVGEGAVIIDLIGGLATNQIPATSSATLQSDRQDALVENLNAIGSVFASLNGSDFRIEALTQG